MGNRTHRRALRFGSRVASFGAAAAAAVLSLSAEAQTGRNRGGVAADSAALVRRDPAAEAISIGRARMAKQDWAGALEAFDAALRTSVDVTVHRDRGICHEQLGHPFPAIDDFRLYLTSYPDAADSDDIRNRLNALEVANGQGGSGGASAAAAATEGEKAQARTTSHEDPFAGETGPISNDPGAAMAVGAGTAKTSSKESTFEQEEALNEKWDQAESSPLRRGSGLTFGAYGRGYTGIGSGTGVTGYGVGATIRGSFGSVSTLYGEIGYTTYAGGGGNALALSGIAADAFDIGLGYEARIRLDQFASNAIILAAILSYERVSAVFIPALASSDLDVLDPRAKVGYRHVFGPGFGIEIAAEAGYPISLEASAFPKATYFGGSGALLVGF